MATGRSDSAPDLILHASCVAFDGRAILIQGASGSGKSALALQLMALGCALVADDRTCLTRGKQDIIAAAPDAIRGMIEARHVGILRAEPAPPTPVTLVITMDQRETTRLPPRRETELLGMRLALLHAADGPHFPAAILQYLKAGPWTES